MLSNPKCLVNFAQVLIYSLSDEYIESRNFKNLNSKDHELLTQSPNAEYLETLLGYCLKLLILDAVDLPELRVLNLKLLAERDGAIAERDGAIAERDGAIAERDGAIAERNSIISSRIWRATSFYRNVRNPVREP